MSSRELLLITRKYALNGNAFCTVTRSFDHPAFPESEDRVRAFLALGGHFVRPLKNDEKGFLCEVTCVSKANLRGFLPISMMKNVSAKEMPKRARNIHKAMS